MSKSSEFYEKPKWRWQEGVTQKLFWRDHEIAEIRRSREPYDDRSQFWIHAHGRTPDEALASAKMYIDDENLGSVFQIGEGSVLSTDPSDRNTFGCFFKLVVADFPEAVKFCLQQHPEEIFPKSHRDTDSVRSRPPRGPQPF